MSIIKKYFTILCTVFGIIVLSFFYAPTVWGEIEDSTQKEQSYDDGRYDDESYEEHDIVEEVTNNVIVKTTAGGVLTVVTNENAYDVEEEFAYRYKIALR